LSGAHTIGDTIMLALPAHVVVQYACSIRYPPSGPESRRTLVDTDTPHWVSLPPVLCVVTARSELPSAALA
jgi:hypothetical protein